LKARWLQNAVRDVQSIDQQTARKIDFYTGQFVDAIAPSNFLVTPKYCESPSPIL
jgi:polyhydroxyalkanoate synthase